MGESRTRALLMSSVTIMLCMALLVGGTYALFSDTVELPTHLQAGTLKVKLIRTELKQRKVNEDGIVQTVEDATFGVPKDFTHATKDNVFGLQENELVAPTSTYSATMRVVNDGGNIAFDYGVYIINFATEDETGENLAEQIKVTVKQGDKEETKFLSEFDGAENYRIANGRVLVTDGIDAQDEFTVTVEFVNYPGGTLFNNDYAQGKKVTFDLLVVAFQAIDQTTDETV